MGPQRVLGARCATSTSTSVEAMQSVEIPDSSIAGVRGNIRRSKYVGPILGVNAVTTMYENFKHGVGVAAALPCAGFRPLNADGSAQPYQWVTYATVDERARRFGSGLVQLGASRPTADGMKLVGFMAKNRFEWLVGEVGAYGQSIVPVPMYPTLTKDEVQYVINQTLLTVLVCSEAEVDVIASAAAGCPSLTTLVVMPGVHGDNDGTRDIDAATRKKGAAAGLRVLAFGEVEALGAKHPAPLCPPSASDIAFFCYTSGTTGNSKGALIRHSGVVSCLASLRTQGLDGTTEDVYLSYLPLPHVFERCSQMSVLFGGGRIAYYQGDPLKILDDLVACRPTLFCSVPRLLCKVHDKILAGVAEAGGVKAWLFNTALASKLAGLEAGYLTHALWDRLVFGPLKKRLGFDRVRMMITGSAPIAGNVLSFLRAVFGCAVHEGYGQTESSCGLTFTEADDFSAGHVGAPISANEIALYDVPDMGYLSTDTVHGADDSDAGLPCFGRGEICFRGPNVFAGYFKMPEKTAETVDADGWCHTGDIGLWTSSGTLKIIDRKKNIFKLSQGEYVAAEKIENVIGAVSLVAQSFVYGDSLQSVLVAIVVPDEEILMPWAKANGLSGSFADLCNNSAVNDAILKAMRTQGREAGLKGFELPHALYLFPELFSVENGLLTPTFKLKRPIARDFFRPQIDALYASLTRPKSKL